MDLFSPILFVIEMMSLSRLINRAVLGGFLLGYNFKNRGSEEIFVSHLLFDVDTLISLRTLAMRRPT